MPSFVSFVRHGLAVLAVVVLTGWALPFPASAETASIARVDRTGTPGEDIHFSTGESATTTLFNLRVDDATAVGAYCVDVSTSVDYQAAYTESGWPNQSTGSGEVHWIVRNSYPAVPLDQLSAASGIPGLRAEQAIAGTQAAIWHFTNGVELSAREPRGPRGRSARGADGRNTPQVRALYEYLLNDAVDTAEPDPALAVSPVEVLGDAPAPLGPLTVHTTSELPVRLTVNGLEGAVLVDELGDPVSEARDGDEVLLALPAGTGEGTATVYAHASQATVRAGRVYTGKDGVQTQPLVVAEPATASLTVSAKVNWNAPASTPETPVSPSATPSTTASPTPKPPTPEPGTASPSESKPPVAIAEDKRAEPELAFTGTWVGAVILSALVLLSLGASAILFARRRRREQP